jgi:hypothetical protein
MSKPCSGLGMTSPSEVRRNRVKCCLVIIINYSNSPALFQYVMVPTLVSLELAAATLSSSFMQASTCNSMASFTALTRSVSCFWSRGGRKVRLIDLPIPIRSSDCISRYNQSMTSSDLCIGRLCRSILSSDSFIDRSCFLVLSFDFCIGRLCRSVSSSDSFID